MGTFHQHLRLSHAGRPEIEETDARALVDTGAMELCTPRAMVDRLELSTFGTRPAVLADGRRVEVDYVGPVRVEMFGRNAIVGALVLGDELLLGAVPMDVLVDPADRRLIPNPDSPDRPMSLAIGVRNPGSR